MPTKTLLSRFEQTYGPYAFGVLSLLLIWYAIVQPQLERSRIDFTQMQGFISTNKETAIQLTKAAEVIDRAADKLVRVERASR